MAKRELKNPRFGLNPTKNPPNSSFTTNKRTSGAKFEKKRRRTTMFLVGMGGGLKHRCGSKHNNAI